MSASGASGSGASAHDEAARLALVAARAADDKQAADVVVIDVAEILAICDHFVVCSASNSRLVAAVAEAVEEQVHRELGRKPVSVEGLDDRHWVLLDYGDVVVHVFLEDDRAYYRLERLYGDAPRLPLDRSLPSEA